MWVGEDGRARVIDFGLAMAEGETTDTGGESSPSLREVLEAASSKLTRTGAMVGSPAYMAPEQLMQGRAVEASDQFSFCVTAFEALHGERPFVGSTPMKLLETIQRGSISRTDDDTPSWVDRVLARGLEARSSGRWSNMDALVRALRRGPRRRRAAVGAVGVLALGTGAFLVRPQPPTEGCASHELAAWNGDARERLAVRLGAKARVFEHDVAAPLDGWTEAWSREHRAMCQAGPQHEAFDRTMHCLDVARTRFVDTVEVLEALEPGSVGEAVRLAEAVEAIPTCTEAVAEADDHGMLAASRVSALSAAGRYDEAIEVGEAALEDVRDPAVRVRILRSIAAAGNDIDRNAEAAAWAEQGYFLALRENDPTRAIACAAEVISALGRMTELDAAKRWYALGRAHVERAADPTASMGRLDETLGVALFYGGKPAEAVEAYDRAIDAAGTDNLLAMASLQGDRGNALIDAGKVVEGREALVRALDAFEGLYGPDHSVVAVAHTNLGTAFAMSGLFSEAKPHFAEALRISRSLDSNPRALGMALGNMGLVAQASGQYEEARPYLEEALSEFEKHGGPANPRVLATLNNLAVNAQSRGDLEGAERQLWSLLERKRNKLGPDHESVGRTYDALGNNYLRRDRFDDAEPHFREALRIFEGAHGTEHPDLVYPLIGLGRCASQLGRHQEAVEGLSRAVELSRREGVDPDLLHDARLGLARARLAAGDRTQGRAVLAEARAAAIAREDNGAVEEVDTLLED